MYAVIASGGKQYRVTEGQTLRVEKLAAEAGSAITFDQVLMLGEGDSVKIGDPLVKNAKVKAEVLRQMRGDKIDIIKFKRRKNYIKHQGHRQSLTEVMITGIEGGPAAAKKATTAAEKPAAAAEKTTAAVKKPAATVKKKPVEEIAKDEDMAKED